MRKALFASLQSFATDPDAASRVLKASDIVST